MFYSTGHLHYNHELNITIVIMIIKPLL